MAIAPRGYTDEPEREPLIGVGFDGSSEAEHALDWAATLAGDVGGRLRLVAVHQPVAFGNVGAGAFPTESVGPALRQQLRDELEKAVAALADRPPLETMLRHGDPASELVGATAELDLLVLGSRGLRTGSIGAPGQRL